MAGVACVVAGGLSAAAGARVTDAPDSASWVTDGPVHAIARLGDRTFIGGDFSYVGRRTGGGVQLSPAGGLSPGHGAFPEVSGGRVLAVEPGGDGSWYIGGTFSHVGGESRQALARIVPDGAGGLAVDPGFEPGVDGDIRALAVGSLSGEDGGVLYIGGDFDAIDGDTSLRNFAAVDRLTGAREGSWRSPNEAVTAIETLKITLQEGTPATPNDEPLVFLGGQFTSVGGTTKNHVAALWGVGSGTRQGELTAYSHAAAAKSATVRTMALGPAVTNATQTQTGLAVYLGGDFGLDTTEFIINVSGANVGTATSPAAAPDATTMTCAEPGCTPSIRSLATSADGSVLYLGGRFDSVGSGTRRNLMAVAGHTDVFATNGPTFAAKTWDPAPDGYVHALARSSDPADANRLYVGGDFEAFGGVPDSSRVGLAALAPAVDTGGAGDLLPWAPRAHGGLTGPDAGVVTALAASPTAIYAGGSFTSIDPLRHDNLAAFDAAGNLIDDWRPSTNAPVNALAAGNDRVYVGGVFTEANGASRRRLAAIGAAGAGDLDAAFGPAVEPTCSGVGCAAPAPGVLSLALRERTLYVGGSFGTLAGETRLNAGAVDALDGRVLPWAAPTNGHVRVLLATCGTVYAGGSFTVIGGAERRRIASLDPESGQPTAWDPSADGAVYAMTRDDETVYVGGSFAKLGGAPRIGLAGVHAGSGAATSWEPRVAGDLRALAVEPGGSTIYAGGSFREVNSVTPLHLAGLDRSSGTVTWRANADAAAHVLSSDGVSLLAGGAFRQLGPQMQQGFGSFGLGSEPPVDLTLRCSPPPPPPPPPPPAVVEERRVEPPPPPVAPVRDTLAPNLTGVRLTNKRFRTARRGRNAGASARRAPVGTRLRYRLSEPATVRLAFTRRERVRCPRKSRRPCYRWRPAGSLSHLSGVGKSKLLFKGRVARRWLRPGRYRARVAAVDVAGNRSKATRLVFTVVRR